MVWKQFVVIGVDGFTYWVAIKFGKEGVSCLMWAFKKSAFHALLS